MITYEDLKIRPVINACGKMTLLGASVLDPQVAQAMVAASTCNVNINELEEKAGALIANWTGAEAACITCGAAAGIAIGTAAFIAGTDLAKAQQLPECISKKRNLLIQMGHMINFVGMARQAGARLIPIGWVNFIVKEHLSSAIDENTIGFLYVVSHHTVQKGMLSLEECLLICHEKGIPVLVDAAAEEDLHKYINMGADLVAYSGGKAFGGPSFGFLCGKKEYIQACKVQEYGIARAMKVTKEGIMGLLTALEIYTKTSPDERRERESQINKKILDNLSGLPHTRVSLERDEVRHDLMRVQIQIFSERLGKTAQDLINFLRSNDPPIITRDHKSNMDIISIDPRGLEFGQEEIIIQRIKHFFASYHSK